jgi:hypothetical protein
VGGYRGGEESSEMNWISRFRAWMRQSFFHTLLACGVLGILSGVFWGTWMLVAWNFTVWFRPAWGLQKVSFPVGASAEFGLTTWVALILIALWQRRRMIRRAGSN